MLTTIRPLVEVRIPTGFVPLKLARIVFVEAIRKCSVIYIDNQKDELLQKIETFHQLNWYQKYLPAPHFFRCHKSFIINCHFVNFYSRKEITLHIKTKVPLSRNNIKFFKDNMQDLFRYQEMSGIG